MTAAKLGSMEQRVVDALKPTKHDTTPWRSGHDIANRLAGERLSARKLPSGLRESVLRALRSLAAKGLVASRDRYGSRHWALAGPAREEALRERKRQQRQERKRQQHADHVEGEAERIVARLAKLLGHLRNTNDHELLVAARAAEALRASTGLEWADLLDARNLRARLLAQAYAAAGAQPHAERATGV